jgi:hypothetical protein
MALAIRPIYESQYRMQRPSQGNGELVFRGKDLRGMEVTRFRVATLDSWETCVPVPFCRLPPPNVFFVAGSGKSILWFVEPSLFVSTIIESLVFLQFDNHRRCQNHVQCRSSLDRVFLLRFPRHQQTTLAQPSPFPPHTTFHTIESLLRYSITPLFRSWQRSATAQR